jgi:hypothetical protein
MRHATLAALAVYGLPLIASLSACANLSSDRQAKVAQMVAVACDVDGAVVPLAQPVIANVGSGGTRVASVGGLLVHPTIVAACHRLGGTPAGVTPGAFQVTVPAVGAFDGPLG